MAPGDGGMGLLGTFWALAGFALVYGVFTAAGSRMLPALVMDFFGGRNVSGIMGTLFTSVAFGTLVGPTRRDMPTTPATATCCRS